MNFPRLIFPLTVDFGSTGYWIDLDGPFEYGEAATRFFSGDNFSEGIGDGLLLMRELEGVLQTFGGHLQPYAREQQPSEKLLFQPEKSTAECSVCIAFHSIEGSTGVMVERYVFSCLRDFLHIELGKAITRGNAPRQCRLCGRWFLHVQGEKTVYCERIAPGETNKTCREVGARAVFENKIQSEEAWKIYKRAYKKYYARVMKGNMSRENFNAWVEQAAARRDFTIELLKVTNGSQEKATQLERLREEVNRL